VTRDGDVCILAAIFAVSNMGQPLPDESAVRRLRKLDRITLSGAVCDLAGQYMESDDHQDIFEGEARSWRGEIILRGDSYMRERHPDIFALFDGAAP
jgi:hypothetical protein